MDSLDLAVSETATVDEISAKISGEIRRRFIEVGITASTERIDAFERLLENLADQIAPLLVAGFEEAFHAEALEDLAAARRKLSQRAAAF